LWFGGYRSSLSSRLLSSGGGGRRGLLGGLGLDLLGLHLDDDLLETLVLNHSILELCLQLYRLLLLVLFLELLQLLFAHH
jgi:hypothetical protein